MSFERQSAQRGISTTGGFDSRRRSTGAEGGHRASASARQPIFYEPSCHGATQTQCKDENDSRD